MSPWIDEGHGILTWSPIYILSLTGLLLLIRERRQLGLWLLLVLLAIYLPGANFVFWWGGFAPPPRYLVAPAPYDRGIPIVHEKARLDLAPGSGMGFSHSDIKWNFCPQMEQGE